MVPAHSHSSQFPCLIGDFRRKGSFYIWGEGKPIVFLPGAQGHPLFYEPTIRRLAFTHEVWVPVLPGDEHRPHLNTPDWPLFGQILMDDLSPLLEEQPGLIGTSFGGLTALWLILHFPHAFRWAVLHAPPWQLPRGRLTRRLLDILIHHQLWTVIGTVFRLWSLIALFPEVIQLDAKSRREYRKWCYALWRKYRTPTRVMGQRIALIRTFPDALLNSRCSGNPPPVLLITSRPGADRLVPTGTVMELKKAYPCFHLSILNDGGHLAPWIHPDAFVQTLQDGLRAMAIHEIPIGALD